jgi:hypothetical protein
MRYASMFLLAFMFGCSTSNSSQIKDEYIYENPQSQESIKREKMAEIRKKAKERMNSIRSK